MVGHYAGLQARAWHWLVALNRAVNAQFHPASQIDQLMPWAYANPVA